MVAELTSIPVPTIGQHISSLNRYGTNRNTYYATTTTSSFEENPVDRSQHKKRPRWIRTATHEPIYSILDDREDPRREERQVSTIPRAVGREESFEYTISAVRKKDQNSPPPNYQKIQEEEISSINFGKNTKIGHEEICSIDFRINKKNGAKEIGSVDFRHIAENSEDEHALYSVVKKPPKKLPILENLEQVTEDTQGEIWTKQQQLHKWLQGASEQRSSEDIGRVECWSKKFSVKEESGKMESEGLGDFKGQRKEVVDSLTSAGVSMPRDVVGMAGPFCRIYRNPNERREYMLKEEVEERGIDVEVIDNVHDVQSDEQIEEEDYSGEGDATAVDSVSDNRTVVGLCDTEKENMNIRDYGGCDDDEFMVIERQQYRRRAKWQIIGEGETWDSTGEIGDQENKDIKPVRKREWCKEDYEDLKNIVKKKSFDPDVPPEYSSKRIKGESKLN